MKDFDKTVQRRQEGDSWFRCLERRKTVTEERNGEDGHQSVKLLTESYF